jgi:predicted phosphodiesterase
MKTISIGDLHGKDTWKSVDVSAFDKVIFVGDYTDSFTIDNITILHNLNEILHLKKDNPDKVVLLLGNHDIQYMFPGRYRCSGYRPELMPDLAILFNENRNMFQIAHQEGSYLWTHAGVSTRWFKKYEDTLKLAEEETLADRLNDISKTHLNDILHEVGVERGGFRYDYGGPTWADINETRSGIPAGYHQIVGHTSIPEIVTYHKILDKTYTDRSITFIDCLDKKEEFYIKEI